MVDQLHKTAVLALVSLVLAGACWLPSLAWAQVKLVHDVPATALPDLPLHLDFDVTPTSDLQSATLVWQSLNGGAWQREPVKLSSTGVWRATLPAQAMTDPGVAYYVVSVDRAGAETPQFASESHPHPVLVHGRALAVLAQASLRELDNLRSELAFSGEVVDYRVFGATAGSATDFGPRYQDFQVAYRYWLLSGVEYIEAGIGRLRGEAESDPISIPAQKANIGFDRGWTEVGLRVSENAGLAGRLVLGGDETTFRIGVAALLRIGRPQRTRLVFEASATSGVGYHVIAGFHLATVRRWPLSLEIILTDGPNAGQDSGERARVRFGHEFASGLRLVGIASYQAQKGDDHGLGFGLETAYRF